MRRRDFVQAGAGALVGSAITGCAARLGQGGGGMGAPGPTAAPFDAATFAEARRYAATSFGRIAYVERGRGPAALFLHGFPLNSFQWRGALDRLSPVRRCLAPDFLAMGCTDVAEGQDVGPGAQVAMLAAFLDAVGAGPVDVVASDSGGAVAQLLMIGHPGRVRSLLLTNCDAETDSPPPALLPVIALAHQGRFVDEWLVPWRADPRLARSPEGIGGMCYADPAHPTDEAIETYFAPLTASARRKELVHRYAIALERNPLEGIAPALGRSRIPVRIVWGMADAIFSPASPDYLDRTFGNSKGVRRLREGKLFWPEERPDIVAAEARTLWGVG